MARALVELAFGNRPIRQAMSDRNPYSQLGVDPDASDEEIRAAFRRLVRERHPDTAGHEIDESEVRDVIDAYRLLIDPSQRARYDEDAGKKPRGEPVEVRHGESPSKGTPERAPVVCRVCRGMKRIRIRSGCPACAGSGVVVALDSFGSGRVRCRACGGRGVAVITEPCPECRGAG